MIVPKTSNDDLLLDAELCRAMFEKDPDKMIELVSEWLESNGLTTSEDFQVPQYLEQVLASAGGHPGNGRTLRIYAS
ncbi:hypothetical protein [Labrenzia sp. DG1229]|uniref:hypothetical protein n=1 Tax=Labrenzia sp. DG1229 TaxID=681847 RepID=UPI00048FFADA|nr:hypothetical protein [Labrenzia sp. DG1229]